MRLADSLRASADLYDKRAARREAHRNVVRVVELSRRGFSVPTIAATVGIGCPAVETILELAAEVEEAEGAEEGGRVVADGRMHRSQAKRGTLQGRRYAR